MLRGAAPEGVIAAQGGPSLLSVTAKERQERDAEVVEHSPQIMYSRRYYDDECEYR